MDFKKLLKRALLAQKDPELYKGLSNDEIASLIAQLVNNLGAYKKELKEGLEKGEMEGSKKVESLLGELDSKYKGVDLNQLEGLRQMVSQSVSEASKAQEMVSNMSRDLQNRIAQIKDGKDGVVTDKEVRKAASIVMSQIPGMKAIIAKDPTFLRDLLETLTEDDRLSLESVRGLEKVIDRIKELETKAKRYMTPGAIIAQRLDQIGDVDLTTTPQTDGQTLAWDATNKKWEPSSAGAGTVDTSGTPVANDFARFTDADTIEGRSYAEVRTDLNVEDGADVTDTTNVTAAGALMDSELTSIADVKALNQSVVSGASPTFATTNMTEGTDKNFVTDAEATVIGNTSGTNTGDEAAADLTTAGVIEIATAAETTTGTDATRAVSPDGLQGSIRNLRFVDFIVVDPATDVAVGTGLVTWSAPFAGTIVQDDTNKDHFAAYTTTAGTTGTMVVDIHKGGTTIMTTNKLDIETTHLDTTLATTQPDLTTTTFVAGDVFTVDVDAIHTTAAKGLVVRMAVRPD